MKHSLPLTGGCPEFRFFSPLSMVVLTAESKAISRKSISFNLLWLVIRTARSSIRDSSNF